MVELVIKVSDTVVKNIQRRSTEIQVDGDVLENAVLNGTPLPKGLEKLADVDAVIDSLKGIERLHVDDELRNSILNAVYANTLEPSKENKVLEVANRKKGCSSCPHGGSVMDNFVDCPDAYTEKSQYCNLNQEV